MCLQIITTIQAVITKEETERNNEMNLILLWYANLLSKRHAKIQVLHLDNNSIKLNR